MWTMKEQTYVFMIHDIGFEKNEIGRAVDACIRKERRKYINQEKSV